MQLILLDKVANLGSLGDIVKVKSGYGRNYLIPQGKAIFATKENIASFEQKKTQLEAAVADNLAQANKRAEALSGLDEVLIKAHASDEGKLYGSVGAREIANAVTTLGIELAKQEVLLLAPIRATGKYQIKLRLHSDVELMVNINVINEDE